MTWEWATPLAAPVAAALGGLALGGLVAWRWRRARVGALERAREQSERRLGEAQRANEELWQRLESSEAAVRELQLSIVQIPEIAQRLSALRELREIPDGTLDLVQEIFKPSYSVFYRLSGGRLQAVACRGESEFKVGHKLAPGEGVVGWTANKQLPFTPEDAERESLVVRETHLARCLPKQGFSLCLPIMGQERPVGVILIGPSQRSLPHAREVGRTLALISSVAIASTVVLSKERLLAKTDGLTGLLNKTNVYRKLRELLDEEELAPLSICMLDLDGFKQFNDSFGHLPGDELLKRVGIALREHSREHEVVGRYGGDEFLLLMPNTTKEAAMIAADRLRELVEGTSFEASASVRVTISGGVATAPDDGADVDVLLRNADAALYQAKRAGRNRVVAYASADVAAGPLDDTADVDHDAETQIEKPPED